MIAGADGAEAPVFFARSATVARYARLACRRRIQSTYSTVGLLAGGLAPSAPLLCACACACASGSVVGDDVLFAWVGEGSWEFGWFEEMPAFPSFWRFTTS